jgi:REP element-mobilizing transposase RayT
MIAVATRLRPYGEPMPRQARSMLPEFGTFHVISRGVARSAIVRDDLDREAFARLESSTQREYGWICHAYCLMTNHYHLVVTAGLERLSRGMHRLNGAHATRFNARYDRPAISSRTALPRGWFRTRTTSCGFVATSSITPSGRNCALTLTIGPGAVASFDR